MNQMQRWISSSVAVVIAMSASAMGQGVPATPTRTPAQAATLGGVEVDKTASKPVYDEKADAKQQIAAALASAKKENRRVLIQWGGNWCSWCIKLHKLFTSDQEIARKLMYEYDVVHIDAGKPAGKNVELAASYGADVAKNGFPFLTILDADGKPLANQETSSLENKDQAAHPGHDPKLVLAFLAEHQSPALDAQKILADGLAAAKKADKRVFLHFGAPWCGWCHRLEDWMAQENVQALLGKDFVDVKIDIDRTTGGKEILARYNTAKAGGIPWFAFVDADGKALADSTGPKGNTGFPQAPEELAYFESMLKKAALKMTDEDIKAIVASLAGKPQQAAAGH